MLSQFVADILTPTAVPTRLLQNLNLLGRPNHAVKAKTKNVSNLEVEIISQIYRFQHEK